MPTCSGCDAGIRQSSDFQRVVGWERIQAPASAKGKGFHIDGRREEFLCSECMRKKKRGLPPEQASLL